MPATYNSLVHLRSGTQEVQSMNGEHASAGACLSQYALIAAHGELRQQRLVVEGWCRAAAATSGTGSSDFHLSCDGNRNPQAAGRLFALGMSYYQDKKPVEVKAEDVLAICTTSRPVAPQLRLDPVN